MMARSTVILAALIGLLSHHAVAQVSTGATQQSTETSVPIYRVTVVGRTTAAINYRPRSGETKVDLAGTALMPEAHGTAEISGKRGHIEIDAHFTGLQRATRFGSEYLTYVLWAITPEGRPRNLGEIQIQSDNTRKQVTTELQAFALIVTAEPYFAVTQPSDVVVMENAVRADTQGKVETVEARYQLLPRGSYLMNRPTEFSAKPLEPGAPLDLAEARNAVELARFAGADRYAGETFNKAVRLLAEAELARGKRRNNEVMMTARQSAQTAEDARLIAVKRQEEEYTAQQTTLAAERERQANEERQRAERETQRAERETQRAARETQNAQVAKAETERERLEANQTRWELQESRLQTLKAQAAVAVAEQEKNALRDQLRQQLDVILDTHESARGLIMMVPDVLFVTGSARLTAEARERLARVSGILATLPDLHITAEGHTDNVGRAESNQELSEQRARSVLAYLAEQKVPLTAVDVTGFGEVRPIASNDTPEGRRQNRRVELIVRGDSIGRGDGIQAPQ
jgi:outer membrane protein OmpA-like peptidoglycan-associated protein